MCGDIFSRGNARSQAAEVDDALDVLLARSGREVLGDLSFGLLEIAALLQRVQQVVGDVDAAHGLGG
jgi:hypothetical protein